MTRPRSSAESSIPLSRAGALVALSLSTALASLQSREGGLLALVRRDVASGPCTRIGLPASVSATSAAMWNGALIHCADYDDTHQAAVVHPSAAVLPAALAAAELASATVGDLLTAYALGCETLIRLALSAPGDFHRQGFHATGICGPVGAAVAAGLLSGDEESTIRSACGIAATVGAGSFEYINSGGNSKIIYPGVAARAGVESLDLARAGFLPPSQAIEGRYGLVRAHTSKEVVLGDALITLHDSAPKDGWRFVETAVKSYPCCYFSQVFLDATAKLARTIDLSVVDCIECMGPPEMIAPIFEPREARIQPNDSYEAKFALPYQIAAMLNDGNVGMSTFTPSAIANASALKLAAKVRPHPSGELGTYPEVMAGRVSAFSGGHLVGAVQLEASIGAEPWDLDSAFVVDRMTRDIGNRGSPLREVLGDPYAPIRALSDLLRL